MLDAIVICLALPALGGAVLLADGRIGVRVPVRLRRK